MIYITGDTHAEFEYRFNTEDFPEQREMTKEWHGGKVHELRPHVLHLMRGQVFEIDGKTLQ